MFSCSIAKGSSIARRTRAGPRLAVHAAYSLPKGRGQGGWKRNKLGYDSECYSRFEQIFGCVERHRHSRWLAVGDDGAGWPQDRRDNLVLTDSLLLLGVVSAQMDLRAKLELLHW